MCFRPGFTTFTSRPTLWARLAVVLLAVLQVIAPSWHVCDMAGGESCNSSHHAMQMVAGDDGAQRPLICYCAEKPHEPPVKDKLDGVEGHNHSPFCLALLLQTMPGAVAAVAPFQIVLLTPEFAPPVRRESAPATAVVRHFEARGPPTFAL